MYLVVYVMKIIKEIKLPYIYISIKDRSLEGKLVILLFSLSKSNNKERVMIIVNKKIISHILFGNYNYILFSK